MSSTPDDYYERARRRAATLEGLLVIARWELADQPSDYRRLEKVRSLERQLEDARYVGD